MTSEPLPPTGPDDPFGPGGPEAGTAVLERTVAQEQVEPGDHERFAHYVRKERILESAVSGKPVVALCGKVWVPGRDPSKFPVCPACKAILEGMGAGGDGKDDGKDTGGSGGSGRRWGFGRGGSSDGR
ncbi:DUF3039 domain-containing protein [Cellulomonas citrea]|uniref:DUF3039 domain-containing protein n=1 Tax=Cellulomonas citrea TaxID=1909423 RepID=UPI0019161212|nr:DUF3039 domain-containing protein [Cellulomonas citrea]